MQIKRFTKEAEYIDVKTEIAILSKVQLKTLEKIIAFASYSMFRMNSQSSDIYVFNFIKKCWDYEGGWDWSTSLIDLKCKYALDLKTNKVYKLTI